jgi:endoglucanase
LENSIVKNINGVPYTGGSYAEFGWDTKHAGINILVSKISAYIVACMH